MVKNTKIEINEPKILLIGQLTRDIPFLTRTSKSTFIIPFYYTVNGVEGMLNCGSGIELKSINNGKLSVIEKKVPEAYNTKTTKQNKKFLSIAVNLPKGVEYYQIFAAGEQAMDLYLNFKKGDTVSILTREVTMNVPSFGVEKFLWIENITKVRSPFASGNNNSISLNDV